MSFIQNSNTMAEIHDNSVGSKNDSDRTRNKGWVCFAYILPLYNTEQHKSKIAKAKDTFTKCDLQSEHVLKKV